MNVSRNYKVRKKIDNGTFFLFFAVARIALVSVTWYATYAPQWLNTVLKTPLGFIQKQPFIGVLIKRCIENKQQLYKRTPMSKCNFAVQKLQVAKQSYN